MLLQSCDDSGRARARELRPPGPVGDAGALTAALDSACGYAALTLRPEEAAVLTVEFKVNLLAPAAGERFLARGRVVRAGRTLTVCCGDAVAFAGDDERHVVTMIATMMAVGSRGGQAG